MAKIGFIGLGVMGAGMAARLAQAGHELAVWNRTPARAEPLAALGARVAESPADCAKDAEFLFSMVADDEASRRVWLGEDGVQQTNALCIECSTLSPQWIEELGRTRRLLDAPVTGSIVQAREGQLLLLVGGDADDIAAAQPLFAAISRGVVSLGPLGSGARMKLINNFLCGVQAAALAEGLALAARCGLDLKQAHQLLCDGAPGSPLVKAVGGRMVEASTDHFFDLELMAKDLRYAAALGEQRGLTLHTAQAAIAEFDNAIAAGLGERDFSQVIQPLRH